VVILITKASKITVDKELNKKSETFMKEIDSEMFFKSELASDSIEFDWLNEIEFACPYIDNIVRNPKLALVTETDVVKIEKAKKVSVDSVKDLSKNTHYIEKVDPLTNEVQPSKILISRREETFNTYENRFIYTLITDLSRFLMKKEKMLEKFEVTNDKVLEYAASTNNGTEKINIELKISSKELPKGANNKSFSKEIESIKARLKKIRSYFSGWARSEFITSLERDRATFVRPPIKKTNVILKNPNFQIAMKLWTFLQNYDNKDKDGSKNSLDSEGNDMLRGVLDDAFLMDYFVLDSITSSKKEQKEKLHKYTLIMIKNQIQRAISFLLKSGIEISDEEIFSLISNEIKNERTKRTVDSSDVKKKFKSAMEEYLEKTQDYM